MLTFQLGVAGVGTALASRQWSIKVTQYACDFPNRAPVGCDQYFFGATTNSVRTFNYNGGAGTHLSNQDQTICVRRERTNCRICWFAVIATDFQVSGTATSGLNKGTICCSYGTAGTGVMGYDCAVIPGAETSGANVMSVSSVFCGRSQGLVTTTGMTPKTICSRRTPFYIRFRSDTYEFTMMDAKVNDIGFQLQYTMDSINCN